MIKTFVTAVIALLVGAIAAKTFYPQNSQDNFSQLDGNLLERIERLEVRLNEESEERLLLQNRLNEELEQRAFLGKRIDELEEQSLPETTFATNPDGATPRLNRSSFGLPNAKDQIASLVNAGFDESDAERIVDLETKMYQSIINARFSATPTNPRDIVLESQKTLRQELGDDQYELYLQTTGRPTTVPVAAVSENSAGFNAGLKVGDEIVSYDGERVFSLLDLQESTQSGTAGQTVIVDVKRGDSTLSLAIPRGQIGISTGSTGFGFNRRRTNPAAN